MFVLIVYGVSLAFFLFAKAVFRVPHRGERKKRRVIHSSVTSRLRRRQEGALTALVGSQM